MLEAGAFQRTDYSSIIANLHARAVTLVKLFHPTIYSADKKGNGNPPPRPKIRGSWWKRILPVPLKEKDPKRLIQNNKSSGNGGNNGGGKPK